MIAETTANRRVHTPRSLRLLATLALSGLAFWAEAQSTTPPAATLSTNRIDFGAIAVDGVSGVQTVTLTNTGGTGLQLSGISINASEFARTTGTCTPTTLLAVAGSCSIGVVFTPAETGLRSATLSIMHDAPGAASSVLLNGTGTTASTLTVVPMIEYYYSALDYYFITSRSGDIAALDTLSAWQRTGKRFNVYTAQQSGTVGINRYYFDQIARNNSRGSHFYTLVQAEKDALASINPANTQAPRLAYNEGTDSFAFAPVTEGVGGSCAAGLTPVFRVFRGQARFPDNPNHRFTTDTAIYNAFVAIGWDGEGVKFCVPN